MTEIVCFFKKSGIGITILLAIPLRVFLAFGLILNPAYLAGLPQLLVLFGIRALLSMLVNMS